jgi:hypothetical protein
MYVVHYKYLFTDHMGFVSGITGLASGPTHLSAGKVALAVAGAEVLAAAAFTAGKLLLFPPFWEFVIVTSGMAAAASQFAPLAEKLLLFGQRQLNRPTASGPDDYVRVDCALHSSPVIYAACLLACVLAVAREFAWHSCGAGRPRAGPARAPPAGARRGVAAGAARRGGTARS